MKNTLMISVAALAFSLGVTGAFAQDEQKTTTTVATPAGTSQTTTTTGTDADGYTKYRRSVTVIKHYAVAAFVAPSGYTYTRYDLGQRVPVTLITEPYELKYQTYGLEAPPDGLTWVRVGNDALLVSRRDGEVVQSEYGIFTN